MMSSHTHNNPPTNTFIKLVVGGVEFVTAMNTLIFGSNYFSAMFSGEFEESNTINDSTTQRSIYIDRDPDAFKFILAYLRTGIFTCKDISMLPSILLEAEFFMVAGIIDNIKLKCIRNLHPDNNLILVDSEKALELFDTTFPSTLDLLNFPGFPTIYQTVWKTQTAKQYYKIISSYDISSSLVANVNIQLHDLNEFYPIICMCIYENISSGSQIIEPMVNVKADLKQWVEIDMINITSGIEDWNAWRGKKSQSLSLPYNIAAHEGDIQQLMPLSMAVAYINRTSLKDAAKYYTLNKPEANTSLRNVTLQDTY